jgi:hypothetical protein
MEIWKDYKLKLKEEGLYLYIEQRHPKLIKINKIEGNMVTYEQIMQVNFQDNKLGYSPLFKLPISMFSEENTTRIELEKKEILKLNIKERKNLFFIYINKILKRKRDNDNL